MAFPTEKRFFIHGRTGCSCCSYENFSEGPFISDLDAQSAICHHQNAKTLASQFAPVGIWRMSEADCEILPDGRIIYDDRVMDDRPEQFGRGE